MAAFSPPGVDGLAGQNVLAIVLGIQIDAFPAGAEPDHNLLKIWAASERTEGDGLNGGFTGSWYNADQSGQGWVVEVVSSAGGTDQFVVYFTVTTMANSFGWSATGPASRATRQP